MAILKEKENKLSEILPALELRKKFSEEQQRKKTLAEWLFRFRVYLTCSGYGNRHMCAHDNRTYFHTFCPFDQTWMPKILDPPGASQKHTKSQLWTPNTPRPPSDWGAGRGPKNDKTRKNGHFSSNFWIVLRFSGQYGLLLIVHCCLSRKIQEKNKVVPFFCPKARFFAKYDENQR